MPQTVLCLDELRAHDPEGGRNGRWLCPLVNGQCEHKTDPRRHRSLSLDDASGLWNCKRCGQGGQLREKWKPMEAREPKARRAERKRQSFAVARARIEAAAVAPIEAEPATDRALDRFRLGVRLARLDTSEGAAGRAYLASRGLSDPALLSGVRFAFDFGRSREGKEGRAPWRGAAAVVFPVRTPDGKLVAAQGRLLAPKDDGLKFLTFGPRRSGVFATPGAWEALRDREPVALAEGPIDALTLAAGGLPSFALCGSDGLPHCLLERCAFRPVFVAFDADGTGDTKGGKRIAELRTVGAIVERLRPRAELGEKVDWNDILKRGGLAELRAELAAARAPVEALDLAAGGQTTPLIAQTALLEPPDAKQGVSEPVMEAPPAAEDLIGAEERQEQERTEALLLDAWRALVAGRLPIEPFELGHGHRCTRPDRWLLSAVKRRARLLRELGPDWWDTDAGQGLAVDLRAFADWYGSTDRREGTEGQPAPAPAPGRV